MFEEKKLFVERTIKVKYLIEIIIVEKRTVRLNNLSKSVRQVVKMI